MAIKAKRGRKEVGGRKGLNAPPSQLWGFPHEGPLIRGNLWDSILFSIPTCAFCLS